LTLPGGTVNAMVDDAFDELAALAAIARRAGRAPRGDVWAGDDAAVLGGAPEQLLVTTDVMVEAIHFTRAFSPLTAVGWKALVSNVSDIAAMGGTPFAAVVGVCGATRSDLELLYEGFLEAAQHYRCPIVGGDLTDADELVISVTVLGRPNPPAPVLRSGARAGDHVFVTAPLGASAAGLRELRANPGAVGPNVDAHQRPVARLEEGLAATRGGATAMIDVSDGLGLDLHRLATASEVGFRLAEVPVASGARIDEALGGGEDYELVFTAPDWGKILGVFEDAGLSAPIRIGEIVDDPLARMLAGEPLLATGWRHRLDGRGDES
jgi:thiamine-monophosphate kinase